MSSDLTRAVHEHHPRLDALGEVADADAADRAWVRQAKKARDDALKLLRIHAQQPRAATGPLHGDPESDEAEAELEVALIAQYLADTGKLFDLTASLVNGAASDERSPPQGR